MFSGVQVVVADTPLGLMTIRSSPGTRADTLPAVQTTSP